MAKLNLQLIFVCLVSLGTLSGGTLTSLQPSISAAHSYSDCLIRAGVEGLNSASSSWAATISPYNLRLPYEPVAVALPTTPKQVSAALKCAKVCGIKVQARGGGHSYGSMGIGGKNGSVVIDMNRFDEVVVDKQTNIAKVGSGVRLGNMALALYEQGGRALPHGVCSGVGIGGHATHGGFGFTSRLWGITLDKIVKLDVVLADGTITIATPTANPELFWALRGAGSSFGIVTTFHFQTVAAPASGIQFQVTLLDSETVTPTRKAKILLAMQEYGLIAPKEIALRLLTAPREAGRRFLGIDFPNGVFLVTGAYWGTKEGFNTAIAPFAALLPNSSTFSTTEAGYLETLLEISGESTLKTPLTGYNAHDTFFVKSVVSSQKHIQNQSALTPFFTYLMTEGEKVTDLSWMVIADLYGGKHSQVNAAPLGSSSYAHRDSLFTYQMYSNIWGQNGTAYPAEGISFMNAMSASMTDHMDPADVRGYANYVDPTLTAAEAHQLYYGNDKWDGTPGPGEGRMDRLERIKKQVDPDMILWNPQAIGA